MSATVPGYLVTITAFLPADGTLNSMMEASELIVSLGQEAERLGFRGITISDKFRARHRLPPSPPAAPDPAEPTQPLDHAPAGPAAAGANEEGGDAPSTIGSHRPTPIPASYDAAPVAAPQAGGGGCSHQRQKRYGSGQVVCLDCQGIIGGEAA